MNTRLCLYILILLSILTTGCNSSEQPIDDKRGNISLYWTNYINSRQNDSDLKDPNFEPQQGFIPPNFSYVGYRWGEEPLPDNDNMASYRIFDVTEYGAAPNNDISDKAAFKATAEAIKVYQNENPDQGAIFSIPEGEFIINTQSDNDLIDPDDIDQIKNDQIIFIEGSNIIVQGAGRGKTVLKMDQYLIPEDESKMWTTPYILVLGTKNSQTALSTPITSDAISNATYSIEVESSANFSVGDFIELSANIKDRTKIEAVVAPYKMERDSNGGYIWSNINISLDLKEKHQIASIDGNTLTFKEPVAHMIDADDNWLVSHIEPAVEVGIQDLTLAGSWDEEFVHHGSVVHDSGYSLLRMNRIAHGWVQNVEIMDFNQGIQVYESSNVTVKDVELNGNPGHISVAFLYSNNIISNNIRDNADTWHAPGLSKFSTHNVHLHTQYSATKAPDIHGAQAINNLFDNFQGGWVEGHWGASLADQPNHLQGLYFWNAVNTGEANHNLEFMDTKSRYNRLIMPHLVGLHGKPLDVRSQAYYMEKASVEGWAEYNVLPPESEKQAYIESLGQAVYPESLYEAQLNYRLNIETN
ncbi:DUF4955 domain-containing protein [Photobacterium satsumensis]|uniref:DUF4955 domain-containing protein n=1 Tax=Photobacterium satsumensis TaxID=2910239 RepID=UPI003D0FF7EF